MLKHDDDDDEERDDVVEDGCEDGLGKPYSSPTGQHLPASLSGPWTGCCLGGRGSAGT